MTPGQTVTSGSLDVTGNGSSGALDARAFIELTKPTLLQAGEISPLLLSVALGNYAANLPRVVVPLDREIVRSTWAGELRRCGVEQPLRLLETAANASGATAGPFNPPTLADFAAVHHEAVEWVLHGYAARRAITIVAGIPKTGKTTLTAAMAGAVASGGRFLERDTLTGPALWMDLEQDGGLTTAKLKAACPLDAPVHIHHATVAPNWSEVGEWCKRRGVALVVVDSIAKVWPDSGDFDENNAVHVTRAVTPLLALARDANVAVVVIGHLRKSGGPEGTDLRGSSALAAAVDILVTYRRYTLDPETPDSRRVLTAFSRYDETPAKLVVERVVGTFRVCGTPGEIRRHEEREKLLAVLGPERQTAEELAESARLSSSASRTTLKKLADEGLAHRTGTGKKGDPYRYAEMTTDPEVAMRAEMEAGA